MWRVPAASPADSTSPLRRHHLAAPLGRPADCALAPLPPPPPPSLTHYAHADLQLPVVVIGWLLLTKVMLYSILLTCGRFTDGSHMAVVPENQPAQAEGRPRLSRLQTIGVYLFIIMLPTFVLAGLMTRSIDKEHGGLPRYIVNVDATLLFRNFTLPLLLVPTIANLIITGTTSWSQEVLRQQPFLEKLSAMRAFQAVFESLAQLIAQSRMWNTGAIAAPTTLFLVSLVPSVVFSIWTLMMDPLVRGSVYLCCICPFAAACSCCCPQLFDSANNNADDDDFLCMPKNRRPPSTAPVPPAGPAMPNDLEMRRDN